MDTKSSAGELSLSCSRRRFILTAGGAMLGSLVIPDVVRALIENNSVPIRPAEPASTYTPYIKTTFVRRKGEYGMRWPGQIYDGKAALKTYRQEIKSAAKQLGIKVDIRPDPIYSLEEADQWVAKAKLEKPDGLMVVLLDRQEHSWPTVGKAVDSRIPTVVFSPIGTSFTTNTDRFASRDGALICSTDDVSQAIFGMKMIKTNVKLRETRFLILKGNERIDTEVKYFGTKLRYLPAHIYLDEYNRIALTNEVKRFASDYIKNATKLDGATKRDVYNGIRAYLAVKNILEREGGDAISMDCLGVLGETKESLPCLAWSKMNDEGIPAVCEADLEACVTHALIQYLFDRPGFQQDPVAETSKGCLIGAHCSCPTKLNGFLKKAEPYSIVNHHGKRDATIKTEWRIGKRITVADIILSPSSKQHYWTTIKGMDVDKPRMIISSGEVVKNIATPPSGGCVVSVMVKLDGVSDLLAYPGFHQLFFYGDYKKELKDYCQLFGIQPIVV